MPEHERYIEVKRVYLEAERLPREERSRFIRAQCGGDPELETQVRRLLVADDEAPEFLQTPLLEGDAPGIEPGTKLGRFRVVRVLGEGGMGVVYEAEEDEPRRRVALKVIRAGVLSERLRSRFRHEIRVLGQLKHPGIAQIYEAGTLELPAGRAPYFAMELVEGRPLLEGAREHGLGTRERLALVAQICDAVHHAHQKGVVHRDLKPGNILVEEAAGSEGTAQDSGTDLPLRVKILDFGIARVTDPEMQATVHTDVGQMVGTVPYMSPEQAAGQPDAVDIRSDVYSIGVIAYELLGSKLPYAVRGCALHEAARLIQEAEPTRLGSIDRSLRGDIETIIGKALEKDRRHRYQSAAELAGDIRRHLRDEPIVARPASALYQLGKFARRHRPLVVAAGLAFAVMAAATVVSSWQAAVAMRARSQAESEKQRADRSAEAARRQAARTTLAAVSAAVERGEPIRARDLLAETDQAWRGWAWRYWDAHLDQCIALIQSGAPAAGLLAPIRSQSEHGAATPAEIAGAWLGSDGTEVIILTGDGTLWRGSPDGVAPVASIGRCRTAAFTEDGGRAVAITGDGFRSLDVYDTRDGRLVRHVADLEAQGSLLEISNDASVICAGLKRISGVPPADDVWLWGTTGNDEGFRLRHEERTSGMALSQDGRWLAYGFVNLSVYDTATTERASWPVLPLGGLRFAISDDGALMASGGEDTIIRIWGRGTEEATLLRGHSGAITALAFDHAGARLASAATDRTIRVWDPGTGRLVARLTGHTGTIRHLQFSGDDSRLMSIADDRSVRLWVPDPYNGATVLRGHTSYVYAVAFTPDGRRIVSGSWDQTIRVWDAVSGQALGVFPSGEGYVTALAVSPDGRTIAAGHKTEEWNPGAISLRDSLSGREVHRTTTLRGEICGLVFSRDGSRLWAGWQYGAAAVLELGDHPPAQHGLAKSISVRAIAVSPDEKEMALGLSKGEIIIADAQTGHDLRTLKQQRSWITSLAYHPTRRLLASASADGTACLWDLDTGECRAVLDRHMGSVYAVAFSPDGACLATGSNDSTIVIWDIQSAEELTRLRGHEAYVYSLAFSPDGRMLASGSGDGTVRVWDTRPVRERWSAQGAK